MPISPSDALSCWLLSDRSEYQTCHIRLPDGESISAIAIKQAYYGFRRRLSSSSQALKVLYTLSDPTSPSHITDVALTNNQKGYFLWVREANAEPTGNFVPNDSVSSYPTTFLKLPQNVPLSKISVPDLDQVLSAVAFNNQYYSVFKVEQDPEVVIDMVKKLSQRGDDILVASTADGSAVCVLEPDAIPA
ncbi:MAG: hypothetical protein ACO3EZ_09315 [Prochlorotrichaceae cyanobacterium]